MAEKDKVIEVEGKVKDETADTAKHPNPKAIALKSLAGYTGGIILYNAMPGGILAQLAYMAGGSVLVAAAVEAVDRKSDELAERIGEMLADAVSIDFTHKDDKSEK